MTAKAAVKGKAVRARPPTRRAGGRAWIAVALLALPAALILLPTTLVVFVGMLPTLAAAIGDRRPGGLAALTVGSLNACGVLPAAMDAWSRGHDFPSAVAVLAGPQTWLVMLAAAAAGWLIHLIVPAGFAQWIAMRNEAEIRRMTARQEALRAEWGPAVAERS
jgi:hypothetical protein